MMASELKPCPFCGHEATFDLYDNVNCEAFDCGCYGPFKPSRFEAKTAWNRREVPQENATESNVRRELSHLVRLLEPMERNGSLHVPGLATLNGARRALSKATEQD
jgi:hypothetical protein